VSGGRVYEGRPPRKYLGGGMNRIIRLAAREGEARAAIEDDFHHFRVVVRHDGGKVTGARSFTARAPYSLCAAADSRLDALVGQPVTSELTVLTRDIDARQQCTHQFDLACLAIAMAARGRGARSYHAIVDDSENDRFRASLVRDGVEVLAWDMDDDIIVGPGPFAGRSIHGGFTAFVAQNLSGDEAEAALVLRRAVFITSGRGVDEWIDSLTHALNTGGCWVQQAERHQQALRNKGSTIDFSGHVDRLTADDSDWLAFRD